MHPYQRKTYGILLASLPWESSFTWQLRTSHLYFKKKFKSYYTCRSCTMFWKCMQCTLECWLEIQPSLSVLHKCSCFCLSIWFKTKNWQIEMRKSGNICKFGGLLFSDQMAGLSIQEQGKWPNFCLLLSLAVQVTISSQAWVESGVAKRTQNSILSPSARDRSDE